MVLNLKSAAAALASASLLTAEANKEERGLVLDAEFRRAMLGTAGGAGRPNRKLLHTGSGGGGSASKMFAEQPRIRRLLANIRRKRELTGPVKRGLAVDNDQAAATAAPAEAEVLDLLVECSLDAPADVGILENSSKPCADGYACIPSEASALGGQCAPTHAGPAATSRTLQDAPGLELEQGYQIAQSYACPPGCPAEVCECYDNYALDTPDCVDALIESCRDGSYVDFCGPTDKVEMAYSQSYCDAYVCLDDAGLTGEISGETVCDVRDGGCADCYCTLYGSLCASFRPLCEMGSGSSDAYICYDLDYVCGISECCETQGAAACVQGALPDESTSAAVSVSDGRYAKALLGASVAAAGLAQAQALF